MPEVIEIVEVSNTTPLKHQLGKLFIATLVAFAATKLSDRAYDATLTAIQNRSMPSSTTEG